jgi:hypothetical protein
VVTADPNHEYTASLRVYSQSLTADELRTRLGEPTSGYKAGEPVSTRRAMPERDAALWILDSGLARSQRLDEHVAVLVEALEARADAIEDVRRACDIDIFCGVFSTDDAQGGFTFEPDLTGRLARLRVPVVFDIY